MFLLVKGRYCYNLSNCTELENNLLRHGDWCYSEKASWTTPYRRLGTFLLLEVLKLILNT